MQKSSLDPQSYNTANIRHVRNIATLMVVFPVVIGVLIFSVFFIGNRNNYSGAQTPGCSKTITSGSVSSAASTMSSGQTLCLQGTGNFSGGTISRAGVTVTTIPGQSSQAKIIGFLGISGSNITITNVYLNANGDVRSPFITGDNVTLRGNEIVNIGTSRGICILVGPSDGSIKPRNTVIDRNRIHDCGRGVLDQGIYLAHSIGARVTNNYIYDSPDFAIQFYPSAQDSIVEYNTIDNTARGVTFSSESGYPIKSSNNILRNNIITNSWKDYNIAYWWGGGPGTGNQANNNCVFNGAKGNIQGGTSHISQSGNINADPLYNNRAAKDFTLKPGSPCAGKGVQPLATPPPATPPPAAPVPPPAGVAPPSGSASSSPKTPGSTKTTTTQAGSSAVTESSAANENVAAQDIVGEENFINDEAAMNFADQPPEQSILDLSEQGSDVFVDKSSTEFASLFGVEVGLPKVIVNFFITTQILAWLSLGAYLYLRKAHLSA